MIAYKILTIIQSDRKTYKVSYCGLRSMLYKPAIIGNTINCTKVYHPAPGVLTKANPKSLGIFCLDKLEAAIGWLESQYNTEIWKVEGIGKAERPKVVDTLNRLRYNLDPTTYSNPPALYGTICFPSIRFTEQVRKVDFTVQCVDCGRTQKVRDYDRRNWEDYRCDKCFELWRKSLPPMELKLYDMRTGALIGRGRRYDV